MQLSWRIERNSKTGRFVTIGRHSRLPPIPVFIVSWLLRGSFFLRQKHGRGWRTLGILAVLADVDGYRLLSIFWPREAAGLEISRRMCSRQVCFVDDTKLEFSSLFHWYFVCDTCLYCNSWEGVIATKYSDINPWCFPFEGPNRTIRRQIFLVIDLLLSRVRLQLDLCF